MRQILVVEDNADLRHAISRNLSPHYEITMADTAREAVSAIRSGHRFDLILSDVSMAELEGTQLYWQLIEIAPGQAGRLIFMSGQSYLPAVQHVLRGVVVHSPVIARPLESGRLQALVARMLELWGPVEE